MQSDFISNDDAFDLAQTPPPSPELQEGRMKAKPILFSGSMVRANIREVQQPGTGKTQTRRVLKPQPELFICSDTGLECEVAVEQNRNDPRPRIRLGRVITTQELPYAPGDVLWVRETWATTINTAGMDNWPGRPHIALPPDLVDKAVIWAADGDWEWCDGDGFHSGKSYWKPSIHMPRWASRLTLEVTDVRVQRLQDISEADAIAEGIERCWHSTYGNGYRVDDLFSFTATAAYEKLWDTINGAGAWDANPWVVAVTYRPHLINVDAFLAQRVAA